MKKSYQLAATVTLPQKLSEKLREKAEETDSLLEELAVEMIFKGLGEEVDPKDLTEHYRVLSDKYLREGKEFLSKQDLVQASEKLWGAAALTVKMVSAKRGIKLEKHGSLWDFVSKISKERGDEEIVRFFGEASTLHRNFYENEMDKGAIEIMAKSVENLIAKLRKIS